MDTSTKTGQIEVVTLSADMFSLDVDGIVKIYARRGAPGMPFQVREPNSSIVLEKFMDRDEAEEYMRDQIADGR